MKKKTLNYESKLFFWEQLLSNISRCRSKSRFIIKSNLKNLDNKNSLTIALKNMTINKYNLHLLFKEICYYPSKVQFKTIEISEVSNNHNRALYKVVLEGTLDSYKDTLKIYISRGNNIFPKGKIINYKSKFDKKIIPINCYRNYEIEAEAFYNVVINKSLKQNDLKELYTFLKSDDTKLISVFKDILILEHKNFEISIIKINLEDHVKFHIIWDNINKKYEYNLDYLELIDLINDKLERKKTTND